MPSLKGAKGAASTASSRLRPRAASAALLALLLVVAAALVVALPGCSSSKTYVVASVASYEDGDDLLSTRTYERDENGNLVVYSLLDGDYEEGEDETSIIYTYTLDDDGYWTGYEYVRYDEDGDAAIEMTAEREFIEVDDEGRPLETETTIYMDDVLYCEETASYTYYDDGSVESYETEATYYTDYTDIETTAATYDEDGFLLTYESTETDDYHTDADSDTFEYELANDGTVTSCTATDENGNELVFEYTYDNAGNIVSMTHGDYTYEITYEEVEELSLAASSTYDDKSFFTGIEFLVI